MSSRLFAHAAFFAACSATAAAQTAPPQVLVLATGGTIASTGDYYGDKDIVVLQGLRSGDRVVVDSIQKVVPGQPVTIAQAPPAANPAESPKK